MLQIPYAGPSVHHSPWVFLPDRLYVLEGSCSRPSPTRMMTSDGHGISSIYDANVSSSTEVQFARAGNLDISASPMLTRDLLLQQSLSRPLMYSWDDCLPAQNGSSLTEGYAHGARQLAGLHASTSAIPGRNDRRQNPLMQTMSRHAALRPRQCGPDVPIREDTTSRCHRHRSNTAYRLDARALRPTRSHP